MSHISQRNKVDVGLAPQAIDTSNVTGAWFKFDRQRRMLFVLTAAAIAATKTVVMQLREATDADGTGAQDITGKTVTITANSNVSKATLTLATVLADTTVTINGTTFTAHATVTTAADREFAISGDDTADAAALAGLINDATYGVDGVTATAASGVITLESTEPGRTTITASASAGTVTVATVEAIAFVELADAEMDIVDNFTHVAAKVTTDAAITVGVALISGDGDFYADQKVAASAA